MASWNLPDVLSAILKDVSIIRTLLNSLLKQDPEGTTDIPVEAKRWTDTEDGKQFQVFNGQSWSSVGKLNHDVASVDGFSASQTVQVNSIAVRDKDGKLAGDILGNAATAGKAAALSATNPIAQGGTGGTTAAEARENLDAAKKNHASSSTDYGLGTETEFGHVQSHDEADASLTGAGGHAFSPAGAMLMQDYFASLVAGVEGDVSSVDTALRALITEEAAALNEAIDGKAPAHHASAATTYGVGTGGLYGHVKLSDYASDLYGVPGGIAATPLAVSKILPPGSVIAFAGNPSSSPEGFAFCNGAAVSRSTYSRLFSAIGTTYGEGNGSTTFNLPDLTDARYIQGSVTAGTKLAPGIPNITGTFSLDINAGEYYTSVATGAFSHESAGEQGATGDGGTSSRISFDASKSSTNAGNVYGKHNTIRPLSLTMRYYIKY